MHQHFSIFRRDKIGDASRDGRHVQETVVHHGDVFVDGERIFLSRSNNDGSHDGSQHHFGFSTGIRRVEGSVFVAFPTNVEVLRSFRIERSNDYYYYYLNFI